VRAFFEKFAVLKGAPKELWVTYGSFMLAITGYGLVTPVMALWLSYDLGYSDINAGLLVAAWSALLCVFTVLAGPFADAVGLKKAFLSGFAICAATGAAAALLPLKPAALALGFFPMALGQALMTPVTVAAVRQYSGQAQRPMAFSLYYAIRNAGIAVAGWSVDFIRGSAGAGGVFTAAGYGISAYRMILLASALFYVPAFLLAWFLLREDTAVPGKQNGERAFSLSALAGDAAETIKSSCRIFAEACRHPVFLKFMLFLALIIGVRLPFSHMDYTFPKYALRELGSGAPIGRLFGMLNPVLIVILVPIAGALTQKISSYKMITAGCIVTALSMLCPALPAEWFAGVANGPAGHFLVNTVLGVPGNYVNPLYMPIILSVVVLSVGEALWSPRLYDYTASIAPKGHEASYMGFSILPYFAAKFVAGALSGWLLQTYCPETGARNPQIMWLLIGFMTLLTPIALVLFKTKIQTQEEGR